MAFPIIKILLERVSVSAIGTEAHVRIMDVLTQVTKRESKNNFDKMPFYPVIQDENYRIDYKAGPPLVRGWIQQPIEAALSQMASIAAKDKSYSLTKVKFVQLRERTSGNHSRYDKTININDRKLDELAKIIFDDMADTFFNTGYEHCRPELSNASNVIDSICSTFVHELGHAMQWKDAQYKTINDYRSYIQRDSKKFFAALAQDNHEKEYLGSPQEIDSFAQNTAYDLLKDFQHDPAEDQVHYITGAMQYFNSQSTRYASLSNTKDKIEQKVLNRFIKRVYQEMDARRDVMIAKHKQELKSAAEKAAYDAWVDSIDLDE